VDQLALLFCYVLPDKTPVKRFLLFVYNGRSKSEDMKDAVLSVINEKDIDIKKLSRTKL
jgi:hypothetical protein